MMTPAYVMYTYMTSQPEESYTDMFKRSAKDVGVAVGYSTVIGAGYVGLLHVLWGGYEMSPQICPRTL